MKEEDLDLRVLASHNRWLQGLTRQLMRDAGLAEDVAQDTWVAYLSHAHRFDSARSLPAYLTGIARNLVRHSRRSETRRQQRERRSARAEFSLHDDSAQIVERAELRQRLTAAVLALREPYRSTLLRHFLEEQSSQEIADETGVPASTVRNRLKRGLTILRQDLERDEVHGLMFLWPLLSPRGIPSIGKSFPSLATLATMQTAKLALPLTVLAIGALFLVFAWGFWEDTPAQLGVAEEARTTEALGAGAASIEPAAITPVDIESSTTRAPLANGLAGSEVESQIIGHVVGPDRKPVAGAKLLLSPCRTGEDRNPDASARESESAADGSFRISAAAGAFDLRVEAEPWAPWHESELYLPRARELDLGEIRLEYALTISGQVLDSEGRAIPRAEIRDVATTLFGPRPGERQITRADAAGRFELALEQAGDFRFWVSADGFLGREFSGTRWPDEAPTPLQIVLEAAVSIQGRLIDVAARPDFDFSHFGVIAQHQGDLPPGAALQSANQSLRVDAQGHFRFPHLAGSLESEYAMRILAWQGESFFFCTTPLRVRPGPQLVEIPVAVGDIRFRLPSSTADTRVLVRPSAAEPGFQSQKLALFPEGEHGEYQLRNLPTVFGPLELEFHVGSLDSWTVSDVQLRAGEVTDLGELTPPDTIRARVLVVDETTRRPVRGARLVVARKDPSKQFLSVLSREETRPRPALAETDAQGMAEVPLTAGAELRVQALHPDFAPSAPSVLSANEPRARIEMHTGASVQVLTGAGDPVELAERKLILSGIHPQDRWTRVVDASGEARFDRLPAGRYELRFAVESDVADPQPARARFELGAREQRVVELERPDLLSFAGQVFLDEQPLAGAEVLLFGQAPDTLQLADSAPGASSVLGDDPEYWQSTMLQQSWEKNGTRTGRDGRFRFDKVPAGTAELLVRHHQRVLEERISIEVLADAMPTRIDLYSTRLGGVVTPADGAWVAVFPADQRARWMAQLLRRGPFWSSLGELARPVEEDGSFHWEGLPRGESICVAAIAPGQALNISRPITLGRESESLSIALEEGGSCSVVPPLVESRGRIRLRSQTDSDFQVVKSLSGREPLLFSGLPGGAYELQLETWREGRSQIERRRLLEIRAGTHVDISL